MSNPWFRLYNEIIDDEKLLLLAFQDRWHFVALLALKNRGVLDENGGEMLQRKLCVKMGLHRAELEELGKRLSDVGLIDRNTFQPLSWADRQFQSDGSTERVQRHRERMKRSRNVTVTPQETETDTETDKGLASSIVPAYAETTEHTGDFSGAEAPKKVTKQHVPFSRIVDLYHETLPMLPRVEKMTETRKGHIRQRWQEDLPDLDHWRNFFAYVAESKFLTGQVPGKSGVPPFRADIEWLTRPTNYTQIAEETYHRG